MDFGTIMGSIGEAAGRTQIAGTQQDMRQAQAEDMRAQAQMRQMSALTMQQDVADRKAIGDETRAATEEFQRSQKTAADVQKLATVREGAAISHNQFDMAKSYGEMAKMAETEQKTALENKAKERHDQNEGVAQAAQAYEVAPTVENARLLANRATAAGQQNIPPVGTPAFASWAVGQKTAAMDSGKLLEWQQKEKDIKAARELKEQDLKDKHEMALQKQRDIVEERLAKHEDKRILMSIMQAGQQQRHEDAQARIAAAKEKANASRQADGDKLTSAERTMVTGVVGAVGEATRGIRNVLAMPPNEVAGAFSALHKDNVMASLAAVGGNTVTPESTQMYTATTRGIGMEIGRALTLGGGRGVTQAQINEFEAMVQAQPGDTEFTAMYKLSNAADILKNRLETLPNSPIKKVREEQDKYMAELNKIPSPMAIWTAAQKNPKAREQLTKVGATMGGALANIREGMQASETAAQPSALPAGWK